MLMNRMKNLRGLPSLKRNMMSSGVAVGVLAQAGPVVIPLGLAMVGLYVRMYRFEYSMAAQNFKMDERLSAQNTKMEERLSAQNTKMEERLSAQNIKIDVMIKAFETRTDALNKSFEAQVKTLEMQLKTRSQP